jgi:hypothetical protein
LLFLFQLRAIENFGQVDPELGQRLRENIRRRKGKVASPMHNGLMSSL